MNKLNKRRFSEFSYGFSFTENLIPKGRNRPHFAPVLPNLRDEKKYGYDIKIRMPGVIFFFQFKIPEARVSPSADEIRKFGIGNTHPFLRLNLPFLRMPITKYNTSNQHEKLIKCEHMKKNTSGRVFYATPLFIHPRDLNSKFQSSSVHLGSGLISPEEIGHLIPGDHHAVAYDMEKNNPLYGWICSKTYNRWPMLPRNYNLHFGNMKCVRIYRFLDLGKLADDCILQRGRKSIGETIEEELDMMRDIFDEGEYEASSEVIDIRDMDENYVRACKQFDDMHSDFEADYITRSKFRDIAGGAKISSENIDSRFRSLYKLQQMVRVHLGCELVIYQ